jgi:4-hydroxyproline epimerase
MMSSVSVIDSHTGGEPTRVILTGAPETCGPMADRMERLRVGNDDFRRSVLLEPRGSEVMVGALITDAHEQGCVCGVIFFNNIGYLGMCGHGLIGVVTTLAYQGIIKAGEHRFDTPVGVVPAVLHLDGSVTLTNVPSYRKVKDLAVEVAGMGRVLGDIAWGGNWFYLVKSPETVLSVERIGELITAAGSIRAALADAGYPEVDHVEFFGPGQSGGDSRNFVLCPGGSYDRSPCGTGTSAKLACLAADGQLEESTEWIQESIVGSNFVCCYRWQDRQTGMISPQITGKAYVIAESRLLFMEGDPFAKGISYGGIG